MPRIVGINPSDGTSVTPESYKIGVTIYSINGKERDITQLVTTVTIHESIYQQALLADIDIADAAALMEDLNITGNEKISIILSKQMDKNSEVVDLQSDWYVLDMPLFARPKPDVQVYRIRCVSPLGLVSKFRRVSHVLSGTPIEILEALYDDLGVELEVPLKEPLGVMKYIPPRLTYSDAISTILNKTMNPNGSPFFAYQRFYDGKYVLNAYYNMITESAFYSYYQSYFYTGESQEESSFEEKRKRILEVSSKLGFSPYTSMKNGSYITRVHTLDWGTKHYNAFDYNAFEDKPTTIDGDESDLVWNKEFDISGLNSSNIKEVSNIYFSLNEYAMLDSNEFNCHQFLPYKDPVRRSIHSNMEQMEHTIKLNGDARLSPGLILDLNFPKVGRVDGSGMDSDPFISGRYLIVSNTHTFNNDGYFMRVKVRRDSVHKR